MNLTNWVDDEFFGRGKVRYLKSYNGESYKEINERFFYTYVLCVAFVKKIRDREYMGFVKIKGEDSDFKVISRSEETALLKVDVKLISLGYKINNVGS